ncbi:DUF982 domain-containing protein [Rhizobium sp. Root1220]|uniref:DUF982 domain-containing protein n=1 Tax=Rhizobium sp. Root1220 TaxID=1736432 RepID=UPI000A81A259|nr:DUF982 domain-containing protein [Rhizobium sp. Root1220]
MSKIIKVKFGLAWKRAVHVCIRDAICERIPGPDAALVCLQKRWPPLRGAQYFLAREACLDAIYRSAAPIISREKFVAASIEAGVLA